MKPFAIQAICEEKHLWEIMQFLESRRCTGILARPLANGAAKPNGKLTRIDAALETLRQHGKGMQTFELRDALKEQGYPGQVGGMLHTLTERGLIRKSGYGKYIVTKKGAA